MIGGRGGNYFWMMFVKSYNYQGSSLVLPNLCTMAGDQQGKGVEDLATGLAKYMSDTSGMITTYISVSRLGI